MNLIFLIGFGYFCFNQVILTSTGKIENGNIPEKMFKSIEFPSYEHTEHKTQLMDLNDDCLFLVLMQLDFNSLLSLAEANNQFKSLVSVILEQMFQKNMIDIALKRSSSIMWPNDLKIVGDYIQITNITIAEQVLNNFGHLIQKLYMSRDYREMDHETRFIYKLVNLHCSKTLKQIILHNSVNNFLEEFTNQFENVQTVHVQYILETDRRLNEIFPSVRRLHFMTTKISNTNSINVKYENLEHLNLHINKISDFLSEELAAEIIRKNSHIRSLALTRASPELIKIAADLLPQLERLKLDWTLWKHNNESITFPNLKIFEMEGYSTNYLFLNMKFGNVEEVRTDGLAESMFGETGFFATNKNLKKLKLVTPSVGLYLTDNELRQLAHANSTLQDILIEGAYGFDSSSILQLTEKSKQLKRLQINFWSIFTYGSISEDLRDRISDTWSMDDLSQQTIILKKEK